MHKHGFVPKTVNCLSRQHLLHRKRVMLTGTG